jgi:hypothetical protein
MRTKLFVAALTLLINGGAGADELVQPPTIAAPQRGSLAGQYGATAFGPSDLSRGGLSLPSPFAAPSERGSLLAQIFPIYSADDGLSEWGLGWHTSLAIRRWRVIGDLDYATDELTGPWGRLVHGHDGNWYPSGMAHRVRIEPGAGDTLVAYEADGTRLTFGGANRVVVAGRGTYEWLLSEAETATGQKTVITYQANSSGRLFPQFVSYGGHGDDYQFQIELQYEPTQLLFASYASGAESSLDRRVKTAIVRAKHAVTGAWSERWRYTVHYLEEGLGPAFYLGDVTQTFASGESAPTVRYTYTRQIDRLAALAPRPVPKLAPLLNQYGDSEVQGMRSTVLDIDNDGRPDIEDHVDGMLFVQTDSGFSAQSLPPPSPSVDTGCRPPPSELNPPRTIAQLGVSDDQSQFQVLHFTPGGSISQTALTICTRAGDPLATQLLDGQWQPGATVRLADVNRDLQPDLVTFGFGRYEILPNIWSGSGVAFGASYSGTLSPAFDPTEAWVQDFNGDGIVDLVARDDASVTVWFGKGNYTFLSEGQKFLIYNGSGLPVADLSDFAIGFIDANKDGLADVLLSGSNGMRLFVNNGYYFSQVDVPGLENNWDVNTSAPVLVDLIGSGNAEVLTTRLGQASSLALDAPEVGLMASADDGKGNVLQFSYGRGPAVPGGRQRPAVLTQLTVQSVGSDPISYTYQYSGPHLHSQAKFFLGYDSVTRQTPTTTQSASFRNDDDVQGIETASTQQDTFAPDVVRYHGREFEAAQFQNIPWLRVKVEHDGWRNVAGTQSLESRTDYQKYEADFCPSLVQVQDEHGTLSTQKTRGQPAALAKSLHCLEVDTVQTGKHADIRLNFQHETKLPRNDAGQVTEVDSFVSC